MSNKIPFQYTILRYIHDLETEEFLNVGLVIFSHEYRYLKARLLTKYRRITNAFPGADGEFYRSYVIRLQASLNRLSEKIKSKQVSYFDDIPDTIDDLLKTILPIDDSSLQFSSSRGGLVENLDNAFEELYSRLIDRYLEEPERLSRTNEEVWHIFSQRMIELNIHQWLQTKVIQTKHEDFEFPHAWENGKWNLLQPISFDLIIPTNIRKKAREWLGLTTVLKESDEWSHLYFLIGGPYRGKDNLFKAYNDAKDILSMGIDGYPISIVEESEAIDFGNEILPQFDTE